MTEGPMGWGIPNEPVDKWLDEEQRALEAIAAVAPQRLMRADSKPRNQELMDKVNTIQQANGIESGFCFVYLAQAIFGSQIDWLPQLIGSCVASGDFRTTAYRMLAEVFVLNDPETLPGTELSGRNAIPFFAPFSYRAGRKEAGINGNSDGSLCLPHIKGKMRYGHLPCSTPTLQSDAFPEPQNQSLYKQWGANDTLMNQHLAAASKFILLESEPVKSVEDISILLPEHLKPANICSMWGFVPDYQHPTWKDETGQPVWIWKRSGQWAHNMSVIGYVIVSGKPFVIIENSWGNYHKGRKWFAIPAELFNTWLNSAECQSVGEIDMSDNPPAWPE